MAKEQLKRNVFGCLGLVLFFFVLLGLDNWFGSGPAIRKLSEYTSSVDSKQYQNASFNLSRIETLEEDVKKLKDEVQNLTDEVGRLKEK